MIKKVILSFAGLLLLYSVSGFLILPAVLSSQIPKLAKEQFNRDMIIKDIQFNPFSIELSIHGLEVKNLDDSLFVGFERLYVNAAVLQSLVDLSLNLDQVLLKQPHVSAIRDKQGDFNFSDMLGEEHPEKEKQASDDLFPISVSKIAISEGKLNWVDNYYSQPHQEEIYPLDLDISHFTTRVNKHSQLGFSLKFASGGKLDWEGEIKLNPVSSRGQITLDKVKFHRIWELFLQDSVNFQILKGSELIKADYQLFDTREGMQLLVNNADINIYDFQLSEKSQHDSLITIPGFKVSGISVDLLKKDIEITQLSGKDARFKIWLNADGSINYQSLFTSESDKKPATQQNQQADSKQTKPWHFSVKQLAMKNFFLQFTDKSLQNPAQFNLKSLDMNIAGLTEDMHSELPVNLALKINDSGSLKIDAQVVPEPFSTRLQIDAKNISIKDFQPYIDQFARLDIISGLLNVNAAVTLQQLEKKPLAVNFIGDSNISDFVSRDQVSNKDFLNWKLLSLNNIDLDLASNSYSIDKVRIEHPYSRVLIRKDKSININDVVINSPQMEKPPVKQTVVNQKEPKPSFKITQIEMLEGESDFADLSLILPFSAHITHLKGSVKGITSERNAVAKVALAGRVHGLSPVNIKGKIYPYHGNSEFELDFKSMPLPLMTPYMAEFAGRKIEKGNMSLGLKYKLQDNQLSASNNLLIDQLVLGEKVENPEAVSLPLDLAIALLEDTDGKIALDVPITGNLGDPQFSVAGVIVDALANVITKVIASPFNAIASLIESEEDISKIPFPPGESLLTEKQQAKLDGLSNALKSRPGLKLEIKGTAFSEHDWPKLQAQALDKLILQIHADKLNKDSDKKILAENIKLSDEDYQELLADMFIQKFPQLAERSFFGTARLIDPAMGDFYEIATAKLSAIIPPDPLRLQELASTRAQTIAKHLVEKEISVDRVYLLDVVVDPEESSDDIETTLSLTVN